MAPEHPRVTVASAVALLEAALTELGNSPAATRTRRQFHQLILALERDGHVLLESPGDTPSAQKGRVLLMPRRDATGRDSFGPSDDGGARIA